ncbi:hypothetical protein F4810DRAFT_723577 [Camillea tinctor]|nr:hypothetical protein F4810DRAFT_723577 [Camillea tinctor]
MFATLKVYEPSDGFLNAPDIERPQKADNDNYTYEAETTTNIDDMIANLHMRIYDLEKIRWQIRNIWSQYRDGFFDLTALNMNNLNWDTYDISDRTYVFTTFTVRKYTERLEGKKIPVYNLEHLGLYDPQGDRASKPGYEKVQEDSSLLARVITDLMLEHRADAKLIVEDELFRGIKEFDETNHIPFSLVFAAQVFLDINYPLRTHIDRPYKMLMKYLGDVDDEVNELLKLQEYLSSNPSSTRPPETTLTLLSLNGVIKTIKEVNPSFDMQVEAYQHCRISLPTDLKSVVYT